MNYPSIIARKLHMTFTPRAGLLLALALAGQHATAAISPAEIKKYASAHEWEGARTAHLAMPVDDMVAVFYSGPSGPNVSCSLLARGSAGALAEIEMLVSQEDGWPACDTVDKALAFKVGGKPWLAVAFTYSTDGAHAFPDIFYVRRNDAGNWVKAANVSDRIDVKKNERPFNITEAVRNVRANEMARAFPGQNMLYRDFMADDQSAFGVLARPGACTFVVDAGATRATFRHDEFAAGQQCSSFAASARLEKGAATYYIALFDSAQRKRHLALFSVQQNVIKAEKELAAQAASNGALTDIRSVKQFLYGALK